MSEFSGKQKFYFHEKYLTEVHHSLFKNESFTVFKTN